MQFIYKLVHNSPFSLIPEVNVSLYPLSFYNPYYLILFWSSNHPSKLWYCHVFDCPLWSFIQTLSFVSCVTLDHLCFFLCRISRCYCYSRTINNFVSAFSPSLDRIKITPSLRGAFSYKWHENNTISMFRNIIYDPLNLGLHNLIILIVCYFILPLAQSFPVHTCFWHSRCQLWFSQGYRWQLAVQTSCSFLCIASYFL